jgi:hypothetical protein
MEYFKTPPSKENALLKMNAQPYWEIQDRLCIHWHETPVYILHHHVFVHASYSHWYKDYYHIMNVHKPLYAMSHYTLQELTDMATCLQVQRGTKKEMYTKITEKISNFLKN